jgi:dolichol-phosphate mannosyltransferase
MKLSVVIPARNEEGCLPGTLQTLITHIRAAAVPAEIVVVDDGSTDSTASVVISIARQFEEIVLVQNSGRHGFGMAVRCGIEHSTGEAVAVMMADGSDSPADLVMYYQKLQEGYDCVFGSRFIKGSKLIDYPAHKLLVNRMANLFIKVIFGLRLNDITNAFKIYRRHVIQGIQPLISPHFNLTVEMPLKAIVRGYSYTVVPISWSNRQFGISKLKLAEMGSRYLFIVLYLWLEKHLSRGDYHQQHLPDKRAKAEVPHA